jgi:hypothetical protein
MPPSTPDALSLQATLVDFALAELVRAHRQSFQPLWSAESWAKLLIWLALNCGCSGDEASLRTFAEALGAMQTGRLRRLFFEREFEPLALRLLADPAEPRVLVLPLGSAAEALSPERISQAMQQAQLTALLPADPGCWQWLESAVAIPWSRTTCSGSAPGN